MAFECLEIELFVVIIFGRQVVVVVVVVFSHLDHVQSLADAAGGFLLLDMDGMVLAVNPVGSELLEVTPPTEPTPVGALLPNHVAFRDALAKAVGQAAGLMRSPFVPRFL